MQKKVSVLALIFAVVAMVLTGCGGGGGVAAPLTGRATFKIVWPSATRRSRLIPLAAQSIKIAVFDGNPLNTPNLQPLVEQLVPRPQNGNTSEIQFEGLPVKMLTVGARAFPDQQAGGTPLAQGVAPVTVEANTVVNLTLTMDSTIDHLEVDYNRSNVLAGEHVPVHVSAFDAENHLVLIAPQALQWTSSDVQKVSVAANNEGAELTGVGAGQVSIIVSDTESGKSREIGVLGMTFEVSPNNPTISVLGTQNFTAAIAGPQDTVVNWEKVDATGNPVQGDQFGSLTVNQDGSATFTAPHTPGDYYLRAKSHFDETRSIIRHITAQAGNAHVTIQ